MKAHSLGRVWLAVVFLGLGLGISATPVLAQAGTAALAGTITDQQGAALPGVTVTLSNPTTGAVRTATAAGPAATSSWRSLRAPTPSRWS